MLRRADGDEGSGRMEEQFHEWADRLGERLAAGASLGRRAARPTARLASRQEDDAKSGDPKVGKDEGSPTSVVADESAASAESRAYDTEEEEGPAAGAATTTTRLWRRGARMTWTWRTSAAAAAASAARW